MGSSTILDIVYALDVQPGDPVIELVEQAVHAATEILTAGVYLGAYLGPCSACTFLTLLLVEMFPICELPGPRLMVSSHSMK